MAFYKYFLASLFNVTEIVTIHYFEYSKDFSFPGETHDFWEFLCVDKGEVTVTAGMNTFCLKKGDIIFHEPNEFHSVAANDVIAPNLVVISFVCHSESMNSFRKRILRIGERERNLLATVLAEASDAFITPLDDPYTTRMLPSDVQSPGAEQMIRMSLEQFLISLYRHLHLQKSEDMLKKSVRVRQEDDTFTHIYEYMEYHISENLTVEQICHDNLIGRSLLQKLFRSKCGCGIIDYFSRMKITRAKELIREKNMNFTQIADHLGYTSIHYFSRQFKKITGMTPSEYALSIKAISESRPGQK